MGVFLMFERPGRLGPICALFGLVMGLIWSRPGPKARRQKNINPPMGNHGCSIIWPSSASLGPLWASAHAAPI
eukprot:818205-Pyramimonas_sp.AAC.1